MKIKNLFKGEGFVNFSSSILAIVCGLLFGLIILLISNPSQAFGGFMMIIQGGFTDGMQGFGQVLYMATPLIMTGLSVGFAFKTGLFTPLIMTGLSVGFAFKTGLFNIGASGQFTAGAFAAVYVGVKFTFLPPGVHCLAALLAAILAGALWGMVPGLLKAFFNVNEVISSIMMNYIGMYLTNMLIQKTVYDQVKNQSLAVAEGANLPKGGLDKLFPGASINVGILIAIGCVILIYILLNKTIFGYELKACGMNPDASRYAGINEKRNIVLSMVIAGALSGLGGALLYLANSGKYMQVLDVIAPEGFSGISVALLGLSNPIGILFASGLGGALLYLANSGKYMQVLDVIAPEGFSGISVALLGLSNPIGILFAGLFIGYITVGGNNMQLFDFAPEVIDIIIAAIIYCGALSLLFKNTIYKFQMRKAKKAEKKSGTDRAGKEGQS